MINISRLYVLIKRRGSKRFIGAIPARRGTTISKLRKILPRNLKRGFAYRIVTEKQLKRIIMAQRPSARIGRLRRIGKRKTRRRFSKGRKQIRRSKRRR